MSAERDSSTGGNRILFSALAVGAVVLLAIVTTLFRREAGIENPKNLDLTREEVKEVTSDLDVMTEDDVIPDDGRIDILPLLSAKDIIRGNWKIAPDQLETVDAEPFTQIALPVKIPEEYTLHAEAIGFETEGAPESTFGFGLVCGKSDCLFATGTHQPNGFTGLILLDRRPWNDNETTLSRYYGRVGSKFRIAAIVRHNNVEVRANGLTIIDWHGDFSRMDRHPSWQIAKAHQLFLTAQSKYRITKLAIGPPLPRRKLPGSELAPGATAELLPLVDANHDVWHGDWIKQKSILKSNPNEEFMRFSVPFDVPEEYELNAEIESLSKLKVLYLGLPFQAGYCGVALGGGERGDVNGLYIDGGSYTDSPGMMLRSEEMLPGPSSITAAVRKSHLTIKINNKVLFEWKGDPRRFVKPTMWSVPGPRVAVGCWQSEFHFKSLKLTRLAPALSPFRESLPTAAGDLLKTVDLERDTLMGSWQKLGTHLISSPQLRNSLKFRVKLPANYEFRFVLERKSTPNPFFLSLPVDGRPVTLMLGGIDGKTSGIEWFEGQRSFKNSTTRLSPDPLFPDGKSRILKGRVKGRQLTVEVDGDKLWELAIPKYLLDPIWDLHPAWQTAEERLQLTMSAHSSEFLVRDARVRDLDNNSPEFVPFDLGTTTKPFIANPQSTNPGPAKTDSKKL